jgi:hypothetical protein
VRERVEDRLVAALGAALPRLECVVAVVEVGAADPEQDDLRALHGRPGPGVAPHVGEQLGAGLALDGEVGDVDLEAAALPQQA